MCHFLKQRRVKSEFFYLASSSQWNHTLQEIDARCDNTVLTFLSSNSCFFFTSRAPRASGTAPESAHDGSCNICKRDSRQCPSSLSVTYAVYACSASATYPSVNPLSPSRHLHRAQSQGCGGARTRACSAAALSTAPCK